MALLQGVTELFPVSSLGHAVIFPRLVGWGDLIHNPDFLPYLVVMHLGTAIALFLYFLADWRAFLASVLKADTPRARRSPHLPVRRDRDDPRCRRRFCAPQAPGGGVQQALDRRFRADSQR